MCLALLGRYFTSEAGSSSFHPDNKPEPRYENIHSPTVSAMGCKVASVSVVDMSACEANRWAGSPGTNLSDFPQSPTPSTRVDITLKVRKCEHKMKLCDKCCSLTFAELQDNDVVFHENLAALVRSAKQGCIFCALCWASVQRDWSTNDIDRCMQPHDDSDAFAVYLHGYYYKPIPGSERQSEIWLSCGRLPTVVGDAGSNGSSRLVVFTDPDLDVRMTQSWLAKCRTNHKLCNDVRNSGPKRMPTRVIDVGDPDADEQSGARLLLTKDLEEPKPYTALSYCWGDGVRHAVELKDRNIDELSTQLPETDLTLSHQEAIKFTRSLGMRYLWIDSLCIIQGNAADWQFESKRMGEVYGNAELTIIAGRAADSKDGFVANRLRQDKHPVPVPIPCGDLLRDGASSSELGLICVALPRSRMMGPVETRGWCFQEAQLSTRYLCFGAEQVWFQCRSLREYEDGEAEVVERTNGIGAATTAQRLLLPSLMTDPGLDNNDVLREWYEVLTKFTPRGLSEPHDIFAAITSLAQLAHRFLQCRYLAGLWENDIPRGLLWRPRHHKFRERGALSTPVVRPRASGRRADEVAGDPVLRAPSWSWAAVQGAVIWVTSPRYGSRYCDPANHRVRPRSSATCWTAPGQDGGFGSPDTLYMPSLELQFYGRPLRIRSSQTTVPVQYAASLPRHSDYRWGANYRKYAVVFEAEMAQSHNIDTRQVENLTLDDKNEVQRGLVDGKTDILPASSSMSRFEAVVGVGFFDVPDEMGTQNQELWCIQIVKTEGLVLTKDVEDKFHRVGWFAVENEKWFETVEEVAIDLV
ncbi:heterokaryon incompatibility protein-domain-containing protein [Diplogelasinospora grovesii]|uniref:Heterokaryon incompatibility protein-domain-containing protein n=1 Tax=Diplogelasinospora grovesii TaxID=303347 RepID=A0AAN6MXA2_9PEZI|nr:heterokaryon incompatibility protein-domain-containing protein [Diplogelasinospora grovesii]